MKIEIKIILLAAFLGILSWFSEALSDYYTFRGGRGHFWDLLVGGSPHELYVRIAVLSVYIGLGLVAALALKRRLRAEESLRKSEELFKIIATNTPDHILVQDKDLRYEWVINPQLGLKSEDMIGKTDRDIFPPDDAEKLTQIKKRVLESGNPIHLTVPLVSLGGDTQYFEGTYTPKYGADGIVVGLVGYFRNVTDRKLAEEELRQSETRLRGIFDNAGVGILEADSEDHFIAANDHIIEILGYSRDELLGKSMLEITAQADRQPSTEKTKALHNGRCNRFDFEKRYVRKDGTYVWAHTTVSAICGDDGQYLGAVATIEDITDRANMERALAASEEKYRELVQNANSIILRWNRDGVLTFFNEFAQSFFGYSEDEVVGKSVIGTIVPETDSAGRDLAAMMMDICNNPQNYETNVNENVLKDGRKVWIAWTNKPLFDEHQQLIEVLSVGVDITQRRIAEESLRANETLLRQFVESTPAAVAMFDREMRYLVYSRRWLIDYKLGDRNITGLCHYDVFPDVPDRWREDHQNVLAGKVLRCEEDKFERSDGSVVWISWELRPWRNDAREIGGIMMFTEVITERKQAQLALQESERKYRDLVETTDTGYMIVDDDGKVVDANSEYVRLTGHNSLEEILGRSVLDWTAPYDIERNAEEMRKCFEQGAIRDLEIDFITPDERIIPVEVNATVIETREGKRILTLCRDITERRQSEEERRALEKQMEEHKRRFYRETILSVTGGKLDVCAPEETEQYLQNARLMIEVMDGSVIGETRRAVKTYLHDVGLSEEQIHPMILGVGEAITNAIKHATFARVCTGATADYAWVAVSDKGKGIDSLILPRAVLLRGFSTKPSLGLGYCVMLDVADHVLLSTGSEGTTVVLVKNFRQPEPLMSLNAIPDTWDVMGS